MTCVCKDNNKCTCFTIIIQMRIFPHNHLENTAKASMVWYFQHRRSISYANRCLENKIYINRVLCLAHIKIYDRAIKILSVDRPIYYV